MRLAILRAAGLLLTAACVAGAGDQPTPIAPDIRAFRPSVNGFAFVNAFTGSPIPFGLGGLESKLGAPTSFGLCGGMSFAAADLFLAGRAPPARTTPPAKGDHLFDYIQQRQLTSFGPRMNLAGRFGRWMSLPDDGLLGARILTLDELDGVVAEIGNGHPVVLGLVFNHHAANCNARGPAGVPWENHQVLAYALSPMPTTSASTIDLHIYDPNYPKSDDAVIHCRPSIVGTSMLGPLCGVQVPVLGVVCERVVGKHKPTQIRGLFMMPYSATIPPEEIPVPSP